MSENISPLISVVIPCYNPVPTYFKGAVYSVLGQSYENWELVVVDDGSNLESKDFLDKFVKDLNDDRISVFYFEQNCGVSIARNKGIEKAKGEIITFLDADDLQLPWSLEEIANYFLKYSNCSILDVDRLYYFSAWSVKRIILYSSFFNIHSYGNDNNNNSITARTKILSTIPKLVFRKGVFERLSFDPTIRSCEDADLCFSIMDDVQLLSKFKTTPINALLYRMYPSRERLTSQLGLVLLAFERIKNKYKDKNSLAYRALKSYERNDMWKFSKNLLNYLQNNSFSKYIEDIFLNFKSSKDRARSILALFKLIIGFKFLVPLFGFDLKYTKLLLSGKKNHFNHIKKTFHNYLSEHMPNNKSVYYASRAFEEAF